MKSQLMQKARSVALVAAVAALGVGAQAQKAEEAWEYLKEPAFKDGLPEGTRREGGNALAREARRARARGTSSSRSPASAT